MAIDPTAPINPIPGINNYTAPSKLLLDKVGLGPLPSQMTGESIEETPLLPAETNKVEDTYTEETKGDVEQKYSEPSMPFSGSVKSSIWQSRYGGSYIEVSGQKDEDEFINIVQTNGTHITLSPDGSIVIKSFGDMHNITRGNMYEHTKGKKTQINNGGYTLAVKNGTLDIRSEGNINISSGMDINLSAAGKLNMNVGDALDLAAARIALTSREDRIDIVSKGSMSLASNKDMSLSSQGSGNIFLNTAGRTTIKSIGDTFISSDGGIHMTGNEMFATASGTYSVEADHAIIGGGQLVSLNATVVAIDDIVQLANGQAGSPISATPAAAEYPKAIKSGIGKELKKSVISENTTPNSPGRSGATSSLDDPGELT
jgi:hypothetical protein